MATSDQIAKREESEKIHYENQLAFWLVVFVNKINKEVQATWQATMDFLDLHIFEEDLKQILARSYDNVAKRVVKNQLNQVKRPVDTDGLSQAVYGQTKNSIVIMAVPIINTLQKILQSKGVEDFKMAARTHVQNVVPNTQVQLSYESSKYTVATYIASRLTFNNRLSKEWAAVLDDRTRDWHRQANGLIVPIYDKFLVGPDFMLYPGDPTASVANVANCRCSLIYKYGV